MHDAAAPSRDRPAAFTLRQAAVVLGISLNTLRKRIADGQIQAERVERPQGHVWRVYVDGADRSIDPPDGTVQQDGADRSIDPPDGTVQQDGADRSVEPPTDLMRAEAMAAYTRSLLEPITAALERSQGEVAELRERVGRQGAELERATSTVVALGDELAATEASRRRDARVLIVGAVLLTGLAVVAGAFAASAWSP